MPSSYSNNIPFDTSLPPDQFARTLNGVLRRLNWQEIFIDESQTTITAAIKSDEQTMGKKWDYKYQFTARWHTTNQLASAVTFTINELNHPWTTNHCALKFAAIAEAFAAEHDRAFAQSNGIAPGALKLRGARFATISELTNAGYLAPLAASNELLIAPAPPPSQGITRIPAADTNRQAIVCGPTGSGKTTGIFIPNLLERTKASAIVTEATGGNGIADLYTKTAGYRAYTGHQIYYFNPDDLRSHQINPLDPVNTYRQARRACEIIFQSTTLRTHRGDQSWEMAERQLLTSLILHAVSQRSAGNCHFGFINTLLDDGARGLSQIMSTSPLEEARRSYFRFIQTCTEGYRNLVINGVMTRLDAWNSPRIRKLTERTTLDFSALSNQLFTLYLAVPADNSELKPLMALILNYVLDTVQRQNFTHPLMLMLDEFTNFGSVRNLPAKLTILRHDGIPAVLGVQDYVQLENMYDKEAKLLISQPATRIFFKPNDIDTAQKISQMLGDSHKEFQRLTSAGQLQDKERKDPLLSPGELLTMGVFDESAVAASAYTATSPTAPAPTPTEAEFTAPTATASISPPDPDTPSPPAPNTNSMIVFLANTHPIRLPAFTWRNYELQTHADVFPPPVIEQVTIDESLLRTPPREPSEPAESANPPPDSPMPSPARGIEPASSAFGEWGE